MSRGPLPSHYYVCLQASGAQRGPTFPANYGLNAVGSTRNSPSSTDCPFPSAFHFQAT